MWCIQRERIAEKPTASRDVGKGVKPEISAFQKPGQPDSYTFLSFCLSLRWVENFECMGFCMYLEIYESSILLNCGWYVTLIFYNMTRGVLFKDSSPLLDFNLNNGQKLPKKYIRVKICPSLLQSKNNFTFSIV